MTSILSLPIPSRGPPAAMSHGSELRPGQRVPTIGDPERSAESWPDALRKQQDIIRQELAQPDADTEFWQMEAMAVEDALEQYDRIIGPLDRTITIQKDVRLDVLAGMGATLRRRFPGANLPDFLGRDEPAAYLRW